MRRNPQVSTDRTRNSSAFQPAITIRILRKILLVIILGIIELRRVLNFRRDRAHPAGGESFLVGALGVLGGLALLGVGDVDSRAVLRADVVLLSHALRGIV